MKNTVEIYTEFDYQGKSLKPSMVLDLDSHIKTLEDIAVIPVLLAKANGIDSYSYQYEILLDSSLCFDHATGLASQFVVNKEFDFAGFLAASGEGKLLSKLQTIAQQELGITDLSAQPALKQTLLRAYRLDR